MEHSLANFGSDTLAQVIQQQIANLGGISGTGQNTATNLGQQGQANANARSNLLQSQGQSQAGGILGSAGIWNNAFNSLGKQFGSMSSNWGSNTPSGWNTGANPNPLQGTATAPSGYWDI